MVFLGRAISILGSVAHICNVYKRAGWAAGEDNVGDGLDGDIGCAIDEAVLFAILADIDVVTISLFMPVRIAAQQSLASPS